MKRCGRCKRDLPVEAFTRNARKKDGLQDRCKACRKASRELHAARIAEQKRASYARDREATIARVLAWEAENREWIRTRKRAMRLGVDTEDGDRERITREVTAALAAQAAARILARAEREAYAESARRQRAAERAASPPRPARKKKMTPARRALIRRSRDKKKREQPEQWAAEKREAKQRRRARIAGATVVPFTYAQLLESYAARGLSGCNYCPGPYESDDHVIPLSRGGAHSLENLAPACMACNAEKGARTPEEWADAPALDAAAGCGSGSRG